MTPNDIFVPVLLQLPTYGVEVGVRADRLLAILLILRQRGRVTARELAEKLEVSERTIHRDMEALGMAGVPIYAQRGAGGGWALLPGYELDVPGIGPEELEVLLLGHSPKLLSDLGLGSKLEAAYGKLALALQPQHRESLDRVRERLYVDPVGWRPREEAVDLLPTLYRAVWEERSTRLRYRRADGQEVERWVQPLGLVVKGGSWYLVGAVEGEVRTYRVSRMAGVELGQHFDRPAGFDLARYWRDSQERFQESLPRYLTLLRIRAEALGLAKALWRYAAFEREEVHEDGWVTCWVVMETPEEAQCYVLGLGEACEVVEPLELRARVAQAVSGMSRLYAGDRC